MEKNDVIIRENTGTVEMLEKLVNKVELTVHNSKIKIIVTLKPTNGLDASKFDFYKATIIPVTYTGSCNFNGGVKRDYDFPVQLTNKAKERWKEMVNSWSEILLNHITNY